MAENGDGAEYHEYIGRQYLARHLELSGRGMKKRADRALFDAALSLRQAANLRGDHERYEAITSVLKNAIRMSRLTLHSSNGPHLPTTPPRGVLRLVPANDNSEREQRRA